MSGDLFIFGSLYRPPSSSPKSFFEVFKLVLLKLSKSKKPVIISGDFNFDLLNLDLSTHKEFLNIMLCAVFLPSIFLPTRITNTTAILIDNIFLSVNSVKAQKASVILSDMSDHFLVSVLLDLGGVNICFWDARDETSHKQFEWIDFKLLHKLINSNNLSLVYGSNYVNVAFSKFISDMMFMAGLRKWKWLDQEDSIFYPREDI